MQGRGQVDKNGTLGSVGMDSWGCWSWNGCLSQRASPGTKSVRIVQHVARFLYRVCINVLINTGLLSYALSTLYVILA